MNAKLCSYLDGEHQNTPLTSEELLEAAACQDLFRQTREAYRSISVPDVSARVMARLNDPRRAGFARRIFEWLCRPRVIRFRPVYALACAAVILVGIFSMPRKLTLPAIDTNPAKQVFVQFRLDAPNATQVRLAGTFTGWRPSYSLQEVNPGVWSVLVPLEPGVHEYAFVVDAAKWTPDPTAPAVDDGFGGLNSRLLVLLPSGNSRL
jgi:hypothetical protein